MGFMEVIGVVSAVRSANCGLYSIATLDRLRHFGHVLVLDYTFAFPEPSAGGG